MSATLFPKNIRDYYSKLSFASASSERMDPNLSIYFDIVRFGAALIVVLNHYCVLLSLAQGTTFPGSDAVILFFVLSGYVIAAVAARPGMSAKRYALDRLSRLWSVAIPAAGLVLVLELVFLVAGGQYGSFRAADAAGSIMQSLVNIGFLGESWRQTFSPYNFPFWSVNYEAWYYIIFGLSFFLTGRKRLLGVMSACVLAGPSILVFMPIWLLGVGLYKYRMRLQVTKSFAVFLFFLSIAGYGLIYHFHMNVISRIWLEKITHGEAYHFGPSTSIFSAYPIALLVSINFIAVANMRLSGIILPGLENLARTAASYTLTVYLFHMPLFYLFHSLGVGHGSLASKLFLFLLSALAILAIAPLTEHKRLAWRNMLGNAWSNGFPIFALMREIITKLQPNLAPPPSPP